MPKILIVEDNEENWDILSRRLMRRGYEVILARDGEQAVDMALTQAPDLILMDMNLPRLDGWEATRRIRAAPGSREMAIIAVTAHAMTGDREKALESGCDEHHAKPVELTRLLSQIETMLKKSQNE